VQCATCGSGEGIGQDEPLGFLRRTLPRQFLEPYNGVVELLLDTEWQYMSGNTIFKYKKQGRE